MKEAGWSGLDSEGLPGSEDAAENQVLRGFLSDGMSAFLRYTTDQRY